MSSLAQRMLKNTIPLVINTFFQVTFITAMIDFVRIEIKEILFYPIGNKMTYKIYFTVYQLLDCFQKARNEQERIFSPSRQSQGDIESQRTFVVS